MDTTVGRWAHEKETQPSLRDWQKTTPHTPGLRGRQTHTPELGQQEVHPFAILF